MSAPSAERVARGNQTSIPAPGVGAPSSTDPDVPLASPDGERAGMDCTCGSPETTSLNPAEVVVHRHDGPCFIAQNIRPGGDA